MAFSIMGFLSVFECPAWRQLCRFTLTCALFLSGIAASADASRDGLWELRIEGHHTFVFGERGFGGGIRVPWEVVIGFDVVDGDATVASGTSRWLDQAEPTSAPPGWFACSAVDGSYLDSNLQLHQTPRVRFAAFPVAVRVDGDSVVLQPGYRPPGNYLAVTYVCESTETASGNWFAVAERAKQVHGKRQDVELRERDGQRSVRVREVAVLPPERRIELPLLDGWSFIEGDEQSLRYMRYRLQRIE